MNNKISITNKQKKFSITKEIRQTVRNSCNATLKFESFDLPAEVSVTFVDDVQIHELNSKFRNADRSTDVLSFPMGEDGEYDKNPESGCVILGDVVISMEHAVTQADTYGHSLQREIAFLTVHSMLHLLGYDHVNNEKEEKEMFSRQEKILENMGITRG